MIGIFDSGIGGLSVVKEVFRLLPEHRILYLGDTARTPYGNKSEKTIIQYALEDARFLLNRGAKIIVVGCNTASAVAIEALRKEFKDIPIFEVIAPAVKKAVQLTKNKRVGIIGTRTTIGSGIYEKLAGEINPQIKIFSKACPFLVPLVEEGWLKKPETKTIVKKYLQPLKTKQIDALILGCTHYPFLEKIIKLKIGKGVKLINPGWEAILELKAFLEKNPELEKSLPKNGEHQFFVSDLSPRFQEIASRWLERPVKLELAEID